MKTDLFTLPCDLINTVSILDNETAGVLFKNIINYANGVQIINDDLLISVILNPIIASIDTEIEKKNTKRMQCVSAGRMGGLSSSSERKRTLSERKRTLSERKRTLSERKRTLSERFNDENNISESIDNKKVSCFTFDEFWDKYPNKTARAESQKKYDLLTETDRELIKNTIDYFINNKPFEKYSYPMATTYINQKRWLDETVQPKKEVKQPEIFDFSKPIEQSTAIKF